MSEHTHDHAHRSPRGAGPDHDVVVIGGGAAGLSGALTLARARRSVLVVDAGRPRNAPAAHIHGYLGREGTPPGELPAAGRSEVAGYGGRITEGEVVAVERGPSGDFVVRLADGTDTAARRLLVATGLTDELPDVPGLAERWGRDVLHCPYCHGWEVRDRPIGVLSTGPLSVHQALLWRQWSDEVTLFLHTGPEPGDDDYERLAARGIRVAVGEVTALEVAGDRLRGAVLKGGTVLPVEALAVAPRFTARAGILAGLGLEATDHEMAGHVIGSRIDADPAGATPVAGIWVAGNATAPADQVIAAAAAGARAAMAINADLVEDDTRRAVAVRSRPYGGAGHGHTAAPDGTPQPAADPTEVWDGFYAGSDRVWSGKANAALVRESAGLEPGRALDLGCGEGGDAIWLARAGWRVTATDVSGVALERAAAHAAEAGVADRIDWQRHDLAESFPEGRFDLVSAHFLHAHDGFPRDRVLRAGARAVAPGGVLLVVGHAVPHAWAAKHRPDVSFPTSDEVLAALELPEGEWEVLVSGEVERDRNVTDGHPGTMADAVLKVRRRP